MIEATEHAVLWPWDILHHLWGTGKLLDWIYDPEDMASAKVQAASHNKFQSTLPSNVPNMIAHRTDILRFITYNHYYFGFVGSRGMRI